MDERNKLVKGKYVKCYLLNEVENVLKIEKRNFELGNEANLSELNEETKQKEKNTSNDFIKITNNYFYDNSNNIKIVEDETD